MCFIVDNNNNNNIKNNFYRRKWPMGYDMDKICRIVYALGNYGRGEAKF